MQFIDLAAQQNRIRGKIDARIKTVLDHGHYIMGPEVAELEKRLADFAGTKHCISCASGTDALLMPLMAWNIGPGDAVFVPPFSFFATAEVVGLLGATPIMVDIDPVTFNMKPEMLEKAIKAVQENDSKIYPLPKESQNKRLTPRAVIPVDLFGQPLDYKAVLDIAQKYHLLVLEDAAQSFGGEYFGKKTCGLGCHAAATSFFPAKPLGCYGDGGAIFTDSDDLATLLRSIRVHGKGSDKYDNVRIGINGRIDTIQAAILLEKLDIFPEELLARQNIAGAYHKKLANIADITTPTVIEGYKSAWAQYSIMVNNGKRDLLSSKLRERGIPTNIYYPTPMHMLAVFRDLGYTPEDMPVSYESSKSILALPFHPYLDDEDISKVATAIHEVFA